MSHFNLVPNMHTDRASSNTGFEESEAVIFYFVVDDSGVGHFVTAIDKASDPSGGKLRILMDSPSLGSAGERQLSLIFADGPQARPLV